MGSKINAMRSAHHLNQEFKRSGKAIDCYLTDFWILERNREIGSKNTKLVEKLDSIHYSKMGAEVFGGPPAVSRKKKSASIAVGSLNSGVRLEENKRIYQENLILFNKFKDTKSDIRKVDLDDRYIISRKYLKFASREP